jgi:serine/threonine protein kinase
MDLMAEGMGNLTAMSTEPDIIPVGTRVQDLKICEVLGSGSFSVVYRAVSQQNLSPVALKAIPKSLVNDPVQIEHLQREIDSTAFLKHPNIVSLLDFFSDDRYYYLVMDYCPGGDLSSYLLDHVTLPEPVAVEIFTQIAGALSYCHARQIAHRDLKPQNIMITAFPQIKLTDFGLCAFLTDSKLTTFCGSACYSAPECLKHVSYDGDLADIWSLGVILYEMVVGRHPWSIANIAKMLKQITAGQFTIPSSVTPPCADLIRKLLRVNPADRIRIEQIWAHGWVSAGSGKMRVGRPILPPLFPVSRSMDEVRLIERKRTELSSIISPFECASDSEVAAVRPRPAEIHSGRAARRRTMGCAVRCPSGGASRDGVRSPRLARVVGSGILWSRERMEQQAMWEHSG